MQLAAHALSASAERFRRFLSRKRKERAMARRRLVIFPKWKRDNESAIVRSALVAIVVAPISHRPRRELYLQGEATS